MVDPSSYFSFQPVPNDWFNKSCGMCYPVCGIVHIKEPLLLIGKNSPCCSSGFPLWLFEWSFTICLTPYNRKYNVLSASLNKHFLPSLYTNINIESFINLDFKNIFNLSIEKIFHCAFSCPYTNRYKFRVNSYRSNKEGNPLGEEGLVTIIDK